MERATKVFGRERVLLTPVCGFATNPVAPAQVAEAILRAGAEAARRLRGGRTQEV